MVITVLRNKYSFGIYTMKEHPEKCVYLNDNQTIQSVDRWNSMEKRMFSTRKKWIDMTRAVGIFAIVYGHMVQGDSIISQFFGSFRVAIFFSVMGLTFHYKEGFKQFIKKKAVRLLIPYFVFAILSILIMYVAGKLFPVLTEGQSTAFLQNVLGALYANGLTGYMKWNLPLWFLPCSFLTFILVYCYESVIAKGIKKNQVITRIIYISVTFLIGAVYTSLFKQVKLPFGLEVAIPMSGFFEIGVLCSDLDRCFSKRINAAIGLVLVVLGFFLSLKNGYVSVMSLNFGNSIFVYFVTAIISIIGIELLTITVCSSNAFNEISRFICYCGTHTIAILCMHKFPVLVFQYVVPFTKDLLRATADSVGKNVVGLLLTVIVIGLCLIVEKPIERYCPIILGQKRYIAKR